MFVIVIQVVGLHGDVFDQLESCDEIGFLIGLDLRLYDFDDDGNGS